MLPGSRYDHFSLTVCAKYKLPREESGGVICGTRFVCRTCFDSNGFKSVLERQHQPEGVAKLDR